MEQARGPASGAEIGAPIGASFGLVFVIVNSIGLPTAVRASLVVLAALVAGAAVVLSLRLMRERRDSGVAPADGDSGSDSGTAPMDGTAGSVGVDRKRSPFGAAFWIIVAVEALLIVGGTRIVTGLLGDEFGVAWVAFVVGVHFLPLARVFDLRRFVGLGAALAALGVIGFCLGLSGWTGAIAVVSGVGSGAVLLAFALWGVLPRGR